MDRTGPINLSSFSRNLNPTDLLRGWAEPSGDEAREVAAVPAEADVAVLMFDLWRRARE